jgi:hypothetical protein
LRAIAGRLKENNDSVGARSSEIEIGFDMKAIAWASCYVPAPHPFLEALSEVGVALRRADMELVVFGPAGDYSRYLGFRHIDLPPLLAEQGRLYENVISGSNLPMASSGIAELLEIDRAWGSPYHGAEASLYVLRALAFWERAFDILQPSLVVVLGSMPLSRLLMRLAQQRQRPAYMFDRGPFADTFWLSLSGQVALASVNTYPSLISPNLEDTRLKERWDQIVSYYAVPTGDNYAAHNRAPTAEEEAVLRSDPSPRILYLGSSDLACGVSLNETVLGDCIATWVNSSERAAQHVAEALKTIAPEASLWIKPHPAHPLRIPVSSGPKTTRYINDLDVYQLSKMADVCVTLASGAQASAILAGCPVVTLGNAFMMGRDIAYEVRSLSELRPALQNAIRREGWGPRLERGRALIAVMFERDLFGMKQGVPTVLKLSDMATLFARLADYCRDGLAPAETRLRAFDLFRAGAFPDREKKEIERQLDQTKQQLNAVLASTSWKMTAPIRYLMNRMSNK